MANPSGAGASTSSSRSSSSSSAAAAPNKAKAKQPCLCSPTNHPGSFRCSRHRARLAPRPSSLPAAAPGDAAVVRSGARAKGRSVLRAHLLRLLSSSPPSPSPGRARRCRDFKPRPSRLGLVNA